VRENTFLDFRPFGKALRHPLNKAKVDPDGSLIWQDEDYCSPPLSQERAVLDSHFDKITVEPVKAGEGWSRIENLLKLGTSV
jgi:hypothetical protein